MASTPNLGVDLLRIHSIISRGLRTSIEYSERFAKEGYPGNPVREGFMSYVRSLVSILHGHHCTEDELAFPYLKEIMPDGPYDLLMSQHQTMVPVIAELKKVIEEQPASASESSSLSKVRSLLQRIDEFWHPHIRIEEEFLTVERAAAAIAPDEHVRLARLFMEHSQQHTGPDFLVLPFMLFNLPPDQRSSFAELMPPVITEQLVPIVWKEKWEPMMPFLLP
jgi:hemerythrin-like domain-containing protein